MMDQPTLKKPGLNGGKGAQLTQAAQDVASSVDASGEPGNRPPPLLASAEACRTYADFLLADSLTDKASVYYRKATELYCRQGQVLKALGVHLVLGRIKTPRPDDISPIAAALHQSKDETQNKPLIRFLSQLDAGELAALFSQMTSEVLPAAHTLIKPGQVYDHFYINISGTLKDSLFVSVEEAQEFYRSPTIEILENDYFGEIYPFDKEIPSHSYIETLSPVEIIKIGKENLRKLCANSSTFEVGLLELCKIRATSANLDPQRLRRTKRMELGVELDLLIEKVSADDQPVQLKGYTLDISIDGICTVLDSESCASLKDCNLSDEIVGETIKIAAGLNCLKVFFSGKISWWKFISHGGQKKIALGIKLDMLPPNYKGSLMTFLNLMQG